MPCRIAVSIRGHVLRCMALARWGHELRRQGVGARAALRGHVLHALASGHLLCRAVAVGEHVLCCMAQVACQLAQWQDEW